MKAPLGYLWLCGVFAFAGLAVGQTAGKLALPTDQQLVLKATGKGSQVYKCQAKADRPGEFEWALVRPDAQLFDEKGKQIGSHYAGPTWEASDGSKVVGQVQQRMDSPDANAIPWLLLKATSNQGDGIFAKISFIERVDTQGGVANAAGCTQARLGTQTSAEYQATYLFYSAVGR